MPKNDDDKKMLNIPVEAIVVSDEMIDEEFQQFLTDINGTGKKSYKY